MRFLVVENFSEKVDPEERNLRLKGVQRARDRAAKAVTLARGHPGTRLKRMALQLKSLHAQTLINKYRPTSGNKQRKAVSRVASYNLRSIRLNRRDARRLAQVE